MDIGRMGIGYYDTRAGMSDTIIIYTSALSEASDLASVLLNSKVRFIGNKNLTFS